MIYKTPDCEDQLKQCCQKLQDIVTVFEGLSQGYGVEPVITRVWDAVCGDSGVHEAHRAVDLRDETVDALGVSHWLYTPAQTDTIVNTINERYPRSDGKLVCIHHSFNGGPHHMHLQVPIGWA
jgi:hypothetical protein